MNLSGISESLPEAVEPPKKVCEVCQSPADKSCGACYGVNYCSVEHQKSHWKEHKKDCPPIKIVNSPPLGSHYVATRDLLPWTLLLTELPVLASPFVILKDTPPPSCISCRSILHRSSPWPCFQCSTPYFCNLACSMNKIHSEFEYGILSKCNEELRKKLSFPPNIYLGYLRAINLKNKEPETWKKVLELRGADQYEPKDADENDKWFIREILPLVGGKGVGFEADMAKLKGILQQKGIVDHPKGHNIPKWEHGENQLLYLKASNFTQNCFPNCTLIISKGPEFQLQVRNTIGIKKDTILSIDYLRISYMSGAMVQKHKVHLIGGALCICPRCSDPTELGTMMSAVKCEEPNCKDGYLLPVDPMDMAENAPWRCDSSECKGKGSTWDKIDDILQKLNTEMNVFYNSDLWEDYKRMDEFLVALEKKLDPNHGLINTFLDKNIILMRTEVERDNRALSIPGMKLYISMIEDMFKITEFTAPGFSLARAHLWDNLLCVLLVKLISIENEIDQDPCPKELEKEFKMRAIEAIDQVSSFAKFYPEIWPKELIEDHKKMKLLVQSGLRE